MSYLNNVFRYVKENFKYLNVWGWKRADFGQTPLYTKTVLSVLYIDEDILLSYRSKSSRRNHDGIP